MSNIVNITRINTHITIKSPYNSVFVQYAKKLAGKFCGTTKSWSFDIRDEADVLSACYLAYGEDGVRSNKCDVQITLPTVYYVKQGTIIFFGRPVARAFDRDSGAKLFDGVVIKSGNFTSGGSSKDWDTRSEAGTVIVLRDVSRPLVERDIEQKTYGNAIIEILDTTPSRTLLEQEREQILTRLAELNIALGI